MWYRTIRSALFAVLAAVSLPAVATAQTPGHVGTYTLVQVAGAALPQVVEREDDCQEELLSATLTLNADGTWVLQGEERQTCGQQVQAETEQRDGRYFVQGTAFQFGEVDDDDEAEPDEIDWEELALGSLEGNSLSIRLAEGGTQLVFQR